MTAVLPRHDPRPALATWHRRPFVFVLAFIGVLAVGEVLRLWHLGTSPAWQWDEPVYYRVSVNVEHGVLAEHPTLQMHGLSWMPFLYQPPFYFLLAAQWFRLVGASIYHARVLGLLLTTAMFVVLFRLLWKIHGRTAALFAIIPVIFDGWLMYIERVSFLENGLLLVIVTAFLLYQRALERPSLLRFTLAGLAFGCAVIFKQTGAYVILAVLFNWLITRRAETRAGHRLLLGTAFTVIVTYVIVMIRLYNLPGRDWFTREMLVQVRRVFGIQASGGTLTSLSAVLHLLVTQYRFFVPSALVVGVSFCLAAWRLVRCVRAKSFEPLRENALLFSWLAAGTIVFGVSALKFPQYFSLVMIPAFCFLWTELARQTWRPAVKAVCAGSAVAASVALFLLAVPAYSYNTLAQVQRYAATRIPQRSIVVTEQAVGDLINQRWCTVEDATPCLQADRHHLAAPMYAITWSTYLQSSFRQGDAAFGQLMKGAVRITSFSGQVGTATVWRLKGLL